MGGPPALLWTAPVRASRGMDTACWIGLHDAMATIPEQYRDLFTKKAFAHLAVGARRGEVRERLLRKEIAVLLGDRRHGVMEPNPASRVHPLDARPGAGPEGAQGG